MRLSWLARLHHGPIDCRPGKRAAVQILRVQSQWLHRACTKFTRWLYDEQTQRGKCTPCIRTRAMAMACSFRTAKYILTLVMEYEMFRVVELVAYLPVLKSTNESSLFLLAVQAVEHCHIYSALWVFLLVRQHNFKLLPCWKWSRVEKYAFAIHWEKFLLRLFWLPFLHQYPFHLCAPRALSPPGPTFIGLANDSE